MAPCRTCGSRPHDVSPVIQRGGERGDGARDAQPRWPGARPRGGGGTSDDHAGRHAGGAAGAGGAGQAERGHARRAVPPAPGGRPAAAACRRRRARRSAAVTAHAVGVLDTNAIALLGRLHPEDLPATPVIIVVTLAELSVGPLTAGDPAE